MELIKPFLKYSKQFRACDDFNRKAKIFEKWSIEAESAVMATNTQHSLDNNGSNDNEPCEKTRVFTQIECPLRRGFKVCDFCCHVNTNATFCKECLFPLCSGSGKSDAVDDEMIMYWLISVSFWELNSDNSLASMNVWRQRLKITWQMNHNFYKMYTVIYRNCVQCHKLCENVYFRTNQFSFKLFCKDCLFPLFIIKTSQMF
ncbi:ac52-like protein [Clanis bilineata nucleopolyhedrovirus]|uniref:Ac52-like protein n=1 Tax=Clanis bilineata nucleopolyhedrovirus TaxID=1307957 RepID=Q0N470_9ABAC|nr:ac52-like protein [Clanis bilineata nucleopolyhedrovirus]ABF47373.1 ac52-like protein [Clanis bilineata nucleopolyhedrovirus]